MPVSVSKYCNHGLATPIKWMILTSSPYLLLFEIITLSFFNLQKFFRNFYSLFERGKIRVGCGRANVVNKWQVLGNIFVGPIAEVHVEKALITAVERTLRRGKGCYGGECLLRWLEDEYS